MILGMVILIFVNVGVGFLFEIGIDNVNVNIIDMKFLFSSIDKFFMLNVLNGFLR